MIEQKFNLRLSKGIEETMSPQRLRVLVSLSMGYTNKAIATEHKVSLKAIEQICTELNKIYETNSRFYYPRLRIISSMIANDLLDYESQFEASPTQNLNEILTKTLFLVCTGLSNNCIAKLFSRSEKTIENRVSQLFDYLGIDGKNKESENPRVLLLINAYLRSNINKLQIKKLFRETRRERLERILEAPSHFIGNLEKTYNLVG
jgi:DNA-binding NarL/FixJ family response regulator